MSQARPRRIVLDVLAVSVPVLAVLSGQAPSRFSVVSGLFSCAALVLRHRWPRVVVVLCLPGMLGGLGWPPAFVALFRLGRARSHTWWLLGWVLLVAGAAVLPVLVFESLSFPALALTVAFVLIAAGGPAAIGSLVATRRELTASVLRLREATEAKAFAKAETARAEERARIAREIHDAVGHHVTLIAVEAGVLATTSDEPQVRDSADRLRELAREALGEMRSTLGLVAEERNAASAQAIPHLVARARESGVRVHLRDELVGACDFTSAVSRALYRVVQEALTNVSKYATGSEVTVELFSSDGMARVVVRNGAPGADPVVVGAVAGHGGAGLEGLAERLRMLGGELEAAPSGDGGFALRAALPLGE